jgi:uncharacterized protein
MTKYMSGQKIVMPEPNSLAASVQAATKKGPPPVHLWHPPFCGDIDMRIARDGTWFYLGTPIGRPALVKLFSQILRREGDDYFLVTPVEKVGIKVDDAPLLAVDFQATGQGDAQNLTFFTKTDDEVTASAENPIRIVIDQDGTPSPYIHVRAGLEALIDRKSFYRLIDLGQHGAHKGQDWFGLWSGGTFFPILLSAELP